MFSFFFYYSPEVKEGKEGAEQEKSAEQENNDADKIEKELEKDKVSLWAFFDWVFGFEMGSRTMAGYFQDVEK